MSAENLPDEEIVWEGRYLAAKRRGKWEYVSRTRNIGAAVILAIHEGAVILVEQFRVPLGSPCLELPAGLVGDGEDGESAAGAAIRELEEETGWRAARMVELGEFYSSPGMASEAFTLLRAEGLERVAAGGGIEGEEIVVHEVPLGELAGFVEAKRNEACAIDVKLLMLLGAGMVARG